MKIIKCLIQILILCFLCCSCGISDSESNGALGNKETRKIKSLEYNMETTINKSSSFAFVLVVGFGGSSETIDKDMYYYYNEEGFEGFGLKKVSIFDVEIVELEDGEEPYSKHISKRHWNKFTEEYVSDYVILYVPKGTIKYQYDVNIDLNELK